MSSAEAGDRDDAILQEIHELAASLSDERSQAIVQNVVSGLPLNPQPLPPVVGDFLRSVIDAVALNPQPLPPEPPEIGEGPS